MKTSGGKLSETSIRCLSWVEEWRKCRERKRETRRLLRPLFVLFSFVRVAKRGCRRKGWPYEVWGNEVIGDASLGSRGMGWNNYPSPTWFYVCGTHKTFPLRVHSNYSNSPSHRKWVHYWSLRIPMAFPRPVPDAPRRPYSGSNEGPTDQRSQHLTNRPPEVLANSPRLSPITVKFQFSFPGEGVSRMLFSLGGKAEWLECSPSSEKERSVDASKVQSKKSCLECCFPLEEKWDD